MRSRQLGDALDERGDLGAELGAELVELGVRVLDDVVEERGGDRLLVEVELGAELRDRPRVVDELLARAARLAAVRALGEVERPADQLRSRPGLYDSTLAMSSFTSPSWCRSASRTVME